MNTRILMTSSSLVLGAAGVVALFLPEVLLPAQSGMALLLVPVSYTHLDVYKRQVFGCIFLGDAFYFLYGMFRPNWHNALGQLLSFLAYDLVLIFPFIGLISTVEPDLLVSLIIYIIVLMYSAGLAVYYLFIDSQTRFGAQSMW